MGGVAGQLVFQGGTLACQGLAVLLQGQAATFQALQPGGGINQFFLLGLQLYVGHKAFFGQLGVALYRLLGQGYAAALQGQLFLRLAALRGQGSNAVGQHLFALGSLQLAQAALGGQALLA